MGFEPVETCRYISLGNAGTFILMNLDPVYPSMVAAGFEEYPDIQKLVDSVKERTPNLKTIDATKVAVSAGKAVAANAVMIGAVAAIKGFPLKKELLKEVLLEVVPERSKELNAKAFDEGFAITQ
jgi:indolepyruvate ferredoxin oxidoreductase beta subunit